MMTIAEVLKLMYDQYKGSIKPYDGLELDKVFCFFVVDENDKAIGNNANFIISKDGKLCTFVTIGQPLPNEYTNDTDFVRQISNKEILKIWNKLIQ